MEGFTHPRNSLSVSTGFGQSTPASFPLPSDSLLSGTVLGGFGGDQHCGPQLSGRQWEAVVAFLRPGAHSREQNNVTISIALAARPLLCPGFPGWPRHLQAPSKMQAWGWVQGTISLWHGRVLAGQGAGVVCVFWEGTRKGGYWAHGVGSGRSQGDGPVPRGEDGSRTGGVCKVPRLSSCRISPAYHQWAFPPLVVSRRGLPPRGKG